MDKDASTSKQTPAATVGPFTLQCKESAVCTTQKAFYGSQPKTEEDKTTGIQLCSCIDNGEVLTTCTLTWTVLHVRTHKSSTLYSMKTRYTSLYMHMHTE